MKNERDKWWNQQVQKNKDIRRPPERYSPPKEVGKAYGGITAYIASAYLSNALPQTEKSEQINEQMVWLSATGEKYHSIPNCGRMNPAKARQVTLQEAQSRGYDACSKCFWQTRPFVLHPDNIICFTGQPVGRPQPVPSLAEGGVLMSTYEEFMVILTVALLIVAVLNLKNK